MKALIFVLTQLMCTDAYVISSEMQELITKEIDKLCVSNERRSAEYCETNVIKNLGVKSGVTLNIKAKDGSFIAELMDGEVEYFKGPVSASLTPGEKDDRSIYFQTEDEFAFMVETRMFSGPDWTHTPGATVVLKNKRNTEDMFVFTNCEIEWN